MTIIKFIINSVFNQGGNPKIIRYLKKIIRRIRRFIILMKVTTKGYKFMITGTNKKRLYIFLAFAFGISWAIALVIYLTGGLDNSPTYTFAGGEINLAISSFHRCTCLVLQ